MRRLPAGTGMRVEVCYHLAFLLMRRVEAGRADAATLDRAVDLLRGVVASDVAHPGVRQAAAAQLAAALIGRLYYLGRGEIADLDVAIAHLDTALRTGALDEVNRFAVAVGLANAVMVRFELRGDVADLRWCGDLLAGVRDEAPNDPNRHELELGFAQVRIAHSFATGEPPEADVLRALAAALATVAPGNVTRVQVLRTLAGGFAMRAESTRDPEDWRTAVRYADAVLAEVPAGSPLAALMRAGAGGVLVLAGRIRDDAALVRRGVDVLATVVSDPAIGQRERYLGMYGMALTDLHRHTRDPELPRRALPALVEAHRTAAAQPGVRGAAELAAALATTAAAAGDLDLAAEAGRSGLQAHAWQVLLQSGTHEAMTVARRSATDALRVARVHLRRGDPRAACLALETGRGLVLHAATVAATVPDLLRRADEPLLADEWVAASAGARASSDWRSAAPIVPTDLRYRALHVLRRESTLFDPPSIDTLRGALAAVEADGLVYLFPGTDEGPGLALVVEADGHVGSLDLPDLTGDWSGPAAVRAATREIGPTAPAETSRRLADDCAGAWDVAIGPLLDDWRRRHAGEPHLVLVLDGSLATVPWHAAHSRGTAPRWAIDEAEFSYIASGRLLVDVARRDVPTPSGAGLVIGNPGTGDPRDDLPGAGEEASTIYRRHYAAGRYCGRPADPAVRADGTGTPRDVLGWLTDDAAGPVLHLACHGDVSADGPASSSLLLADGAVLSAEEILRGRPGRGAGGLVTLAACTTHRAARAHDEAVTLSTAFLVAGAATTIGSLWSVPDRGTARLMVAFHDNLAGRGMPPRRALREAQRAMRDVGDGTTLADWAGFVHLGR
ncbi:CHAT domain-containing protein [Asanoa siamensis]|uniref:CHAT domain-containing protein n=1 Tax=Asanoa siamensis TaxID=926357 RepID=A0ABQ4CNZ5_9ACTN|nr:CHAT domain-containing protein [Asanoa siamensis]GIF73007.1 hypothetical protein Asi02nite_25250 [Asanoa siamensis]